MTTTRDVWLLWLLLLGIVGCSGPPTPAPPIVPVVPLAAPPPAAPPAAVAPTSAPSGPAANLGPVGAAELAQAQQCAGQNDNACVIQTLAGRAQSPLERGLLIDAYMASTDMDSTLREMRAFLAVYPNDSRAPTYRTTIAAFSH